MVDRRQILASSTTLVAAGVAGCLGGSDESGNGNENGDGNGNGNGDSSGNGDDGTTSQSVDEPYEVCIEPAGCHTFEEVPETVFTIPGSSEDMAMSLGIQVDAHAYPERKPYKFYEQLPGVEHDPDEITQYGEGESARNYDKEIFYEVDPDVILADPRMLQFYSNWTDDDMAEIEQNVAPILGSYIRFEYEGEQPYYSMYEYFEKIAKIFQRQAQYKAWIDLHDTFISKIKSNLPEDHNPAVAACAFDVESGKIWPMPIGEKNNTAQSYYDLGFRDAFAEAGMDPANTIGFEAMAELDPEYIGTYNLSYMNGEEWQAQVVEPLKDHPVGSQLSAVQNGNLVRTAGQFMGPITNLFSTEALAKQVYPDRFSEWPGDSVDIPEDEQLFDRQRVAEIVNNDI